MKAMKKERSGEEDQERVFKLKSLWKLWLAKKAEKKNESEDEEILDCEVSAEEEVTSDEQKRKIAEEQKIWNKGQRTVAQEW